MVSACWLSVEIQAQPKTANCQESWSSISATATLNLRRSFWESGRIIRHVPMDEYYSACCYPMLGLTFKEPPHLLEDIAMNEKMAMRATKLETIESPMEGLFPDDPVRDSLGRTAKADASQVSRACYRPLKKVDLSSTNLLNHDNCSGVPASRAYCNLSSMPCSSLLTES